MTDNIVEAVTSRYVDVYFRGKRTCRTPSITQTDYGLIYRFCDLSLPSTFEMHFANSQTGTSKRVLGSNGEIDIPTEFIVSGQNVYSFIVLHETPDDGETRYTIISPVTAKGPVSPSEPTPVQQDVVTQAIAALNSGVETVEQIAEGIPDQIDTALAEAKASGEFDGPPGDDGISPVARVEQTTTGATVTVTDKDGTTTAQLTNGTNGLDGISPTVTITEIIGGHRIIITDATGAHFVDVTDGEDGVSPTVAVESITGGHEVTITDATGDHTFDVMDGTTPTVPVTDVQVNGTSVVSGGVANVPIMSADVNGVANLGNSDGLYGLIVTTGTLMINPADDYAMKTGSGKRKPITSEIQHKSVFYGLAKAAGDTTQSASSNAVGSYTEQAKSAISTMLSGSVSVSGTTPTITALPGIQYVCGDVSTLDITLPAYGCIDVVFESGSTATVLTVTPPTGKTLSWTGDFDQTALEADTVYEINVAVVGDKCLGVAASWT